MLNQDDVNNSQFGSLDSLINAICLLDAQYVRPMPYEIVPFRPKIPFNQPRPKTLTVRERLASVSSLDSLGSLETIEYRPQVELTRPKIPRKRIGREQTKALQTLFDDGIHFPNRETRIHLSRELGLSVRTIQVWFQNRRQAVKNNARAAAAMQSPSNGGCNEKEKERKSQLMEKMSIRWMKPVVFTSTLGSHATPSRLAKS